MGPSFSSIRVHTGFVPGPFLVGSVSVPCRSRTDLTRNVWLRYGPWIWFKVSEPWRNEKCKIQLHFDLKSSTKDHFQIQVIINSQCHVISITWQNVNFISESNKSFTISSKDNISSNWHLERFIECYRGSALESYLKLAYLSQQYPVNELSDAYFMSKIKNFKRKWRVWTP